MVRINKFEFVEVQCLGIASTGQTATKFSFPDLPKMRYTALQAIETYTTNTLSTTPLNNTIPTLAVLKTAYLVLYADERQDIYRVPFLNMNRIQNASTDPFVRGLWEFSGQKVTWDKCYVELTAAPGNTTNTSFCFGVYYV